MFPDLDRGVLPGPRARPASRPCAWLAVAAACIACAASGCTRNEKGLCMQLRSLGVQMGHVLSEGRDTGDDLPRAPDGFAALARGLADKRRIMWETYACDLKGRKGDPCGWMYVEGLQLGRGDIAMCWSKRPHHGCYCVVFANTRARVIEESEWVAFVREQAELRAALGRPLRVIE